MVKILISLALIHIVLYSVFTNLHAHETKTHPVSVIRSPDGYTLSIKAINVPLGKLLEELIKQCPMRVITYEEAIVSQPITINFKDVPLEQGIKRLLKISGIKNYLIQYRNDEENRSLIAQLTLLCNGNKAGETEITMNSIKRGKEKDDITPLTTETLSSEDEFAEKVAAVKERYEWFDEETKELAGYLLELMPEPARGPGMEKLMQELDRKIADEGNHTVDETIFFQALEETAPSHLAPVMMRSVKHYRQRYKTGDTHEIYEESPNEFYQEFMSKRVSKRDRNQKGGSNYGHENH